MENAMNINDAWNTLLSCWREGTLRSAWAREQFVPSVARQADRKGGPHTLSPKQQAIIVKLAQEQIAEPEERPTIRCSNLADLFDGAAANLKWPKITFQFILVPEVRDRNRAKHGEDLADLGSLTKKQAAIMLRLFAEEHTIRLQRAGEKANYPGSITVKADGRWAGRIHRDGTFEMSHNIPDWTVEFLQAFNKSPQKISAWFGRNSGNCCYCNRWLTDDRSLEVGYGEQCARNYHQPWGSK